jgi:hypothetical protein
VIFGVVVSDVVVSDVIVLHIHPTQPIHRSIIHTKIPNDNPMIKNIQDSRVSKTILKNQKFKILK